MAVLALSTAVIGPATAGPVDSAVQPPSLRFGVLFHDDPMDLGAAGPSAGDEQILHDTLVDSAGKTVGHDGGVCTFTDVTVPEAMCVVTFSVPGGQLATQFLNTPPPQKTGAITGGSGAFRDARGQFSLTENPDQTGVVVFRPDRSPDHRSG